MRDLSLHVDLALLDHPNQPNVVHRAAAERPDDLELLEHDLAGDDRDGLMRVADHAQPPAYPNTVERLFNRPRIPDDLHGDVGPAAGEFLDLFADAIDLRCVNGLGGPELGRPLKLAFVDVHGDHITAHRRGHLHRIDPHATATENHHGVTRFHLRSVLDRVIGRGNRIGDDRRLLKGNRLRQIQNILGRHS